MFECCSPSLEVQSVILLANLFSPTLEIAYDKEKSFLSLRSTCLSQVNLLLWTSILLQQGIEDRFEYTDNALELLILEKADLPLGILMSMSMFELFWTVELILVSLDVVVRIKDNRLGFYFIFSHFPFIFSYFLLKEYKTKKTKCDMVTEVTCSHNTKKGIESSGTR